jgi:hypothetical protein
LVVCSHRIRARTMPIQPPPSSLSSSSLLLLYNIIIVEITRSWSLLLFLFLHYKHALAFVHFYNCFNKPKF